MQSSAREPSPVRDDDDFVYDSKSSRTKRSHDTAFQGEYFMSGALPVDNSIFSRIFRAANTLTTAVATCASYLTGLTLFGNIAKRFTEVTPPVEIIAVPVTSNTGSRKKIFLDANFSHNAHKLSNVLVDPRSASRSNSVILSGSVSSTTRKLAPKKHAARRTRTVASQQPAIHHDFMPIDTGVPEHMRSAYHSIEDAITLYQKESHEPTDRQEDMKFDFAKSEREAIIAGLNKSGAQTRMMLADKFVEPDPSIFEPLNLTNRGLNKNRGLRAAEKRRKHVEKHIPAYMAVEKQDKAVIQRFLQKAKKDMISSPETDEARTKWYRVRKMVANKLGVKFNASPKKPKKAREEPYIPTWKRKSPFDWMFRNDVTSDSEDELADETADDSLDHGIGLVSDETTPTTEQPAITNTVERAPVPYCEELSTLEDAPPRPPPKNVTFNPQVQKRPFRSDLGIWENAERYREKIWNSPLKEPPPYGWAVGMAAMLMNASSNTNGTVEQCFTTVTHEDLFSSDEVPLDLDDELPFNLDDLEKLNLKDSFLELEPSTAAKQDILEKAQAQRAAEEEAARKIQQAEEEAARKQAEEEAKKAEEEAKKRAEEEAAAKKAKEAAEKKKAAARPLVSPLSDHWIKELDAVAAKARGPSSTPAYKVIGDLTRHDFGTLLPSQFGGATSAWLNDEIVNEYLRLLVEDVQRNKGYDKSTKAAPPVYAFPSQWWTKVQEPAGCTGTLRWTTRAHLSTRQKESKIMDAELILFPLCGQNHWTLLAVLPQKREIQYLDSLNLSPATALGKAREWLQVELGNAYRAEEWTETAKHSARQVNGSDCGVFTLLNALALMRGSASKVIEVSNGMLAARQQIAATLLKGAANEEFSV